MNFNNMMANSPWYKRMKMPGATPMAGAAAGPAKPVGGATAPWNPAAGARPVTPAPFVSASMPAGTPATLPPTALPAGAAPAPAAPAATKTFKRVANGIDYRANVGGKRA